MAVKEIVAGKETVVRRRGADWSFHLPYMHRIEVDQENNLVALSMPDSGSTYELGGIEETDDEVIVLLGHESGGHAVGVGEGAPEPGYRLPEIQDEVERLRGRWDNAGLPAHEFIAYGTGETHEDRFRMIRRRLREAGA